MFLLFMDEKYSHKYLIALIFITQLLLIFIKSANVLFILL